MGQGTFQETEQARQWQVWTKSGDGLAIRSGILKENSGNRNGSWNVQETELAKQQQAKTKSGNGLASRSGIRNRRYREHELVRERFKEQNWGLGNNRLRVRQEWFSKQFRES
jgi:hypothetical protein